MSIKEINTVAEKVKRFRRRLEQEGITGEHQQVILKVYIQDITSKINTNLLRKVV